MKTELQQVTFHFSNGVRVDWMQTDTINPRTSKRWKWNVEVQIGSGAVYYSCDCSPNKTNTLWLLSAARKSRENPAVDKEPGT